MARSGNIRRKYPTGRSVPTEYNDCNEQESGCSAQTSADDFETKPREDIGLDKVLQFTDRCLLDCVTPLKLQYSTRNAYMPSLLWYDRSRDYSLEDYFVNLQMDEDDLMGRFKKRRNVEQQELFASLDNKTLRKRILVTGKPGFGKTTLIKKLAYDWATLKHPHYLSNFDLMIVVHLRKLGNTSVAEFLQQALRLKPGDPTTVLQTTNLDILLLLDGFDELSETRDLLKFIRAETESYRYSSKMTILLTSRPHAVERFRMEFQRRLTITGFRRESQIRYVNLAMGRSSKIASKLLSQLQKNSFLSELAQCPLMLHLLCCLHQEIDLTRVKRMTDLYVEIFTLIITRYVRKYNEHPSLNGGKYIPGETLLAKFGAVAFMYLRKRISAITESELKRIFSDEEYEVLKRLDFLVGSQVPTKTGEFETEYEVLHRTFVEFLSSLHLAVNYESLEVLERKRTYVDVYGIRHHSKDIELALTDHEIFLLCYFGLTSDRSILNRFLKLAVQLATGKSVSLLSNLKNEVGIALWKECTKEMKFLDFDCGKDPIIDLVNVLREDFLEELALHFTSHCTLVHIKDIFEAAASCHSLKTIFVFPQTHVYMQLATSETDDLKAVTFYVDLGLAMDTIIKFVSLQSAMELTMKLVGETQYVHDVTRKESSYFNFQEANFIGLIVYDSSPDREENGNNNAFQETSSLRFEMVTENITIGMTFRNCVYRFGGRHVDMEKKVVFFVTRDQYTFLAFHPTLSIFIEKGKVAMRQSLYKQLELQK